MADGRKLDERCENALICDVFTYGRHRERLCEQRGCSGMLHSPHHLASWRMKRRI
ncbi:hypothetical protein PLANPX_1827 [Lacipirellula parvula]|uniref:Uncharacterized protein n=1 Tax=Lacipirellula parvula TaxID=2650471 RepID=A0A5K7X765_9BACT|nr:hypothetical protein PLANPX_1827 [Lacipirellula parvula]